MEYCYSEADIIVANQIKNGIEKCGNGYASLVCLYIEGFVRKEKIWSLCMCTLIELYKLL